MEVTMLLDLGTTFSSTVFYLSDATFNVLANFSTLGQPLSKRATFVCFSKTLSRKTLYLASMFV